MREYIWDTHSHLYSFEDISSLVLKLRRERIRVIVVGEDKETNQKAKELAEEFPDLLFPAFGLHPFLLNRVNWKEERRWLEDNLSRAIALGEIGLDFKGRASPEYQREVFRELLYLARQFNLPVIIHSRKAARECVEEVEKAGWERVIFHWFTGNLSLVERGLSLGAYFSIGPQVRKSHSWKRVLRRVPIERLLLETDSPVPFQGRPATPLDVREVIEEISRVKGIDEGKVIEITSRNTREIFFSGEEKC